MPGRKALEPLSLPRFAEAVERESILLERSWFPGDRKPSRLNRLLGTVLAQTLIVTLDVTISSIWSNLYPEGAAVPHHHHFRPYTELVLLLWVHGRRVAVRLRPLMVSLLALPENPFVSGAQGFRRLVDDPVSGQMGNASEPDMQKTVRMAHHVALVMTSGWILEVTQQLNHPDDSVLPAFPELVLP